MARDFNLRNWLSWLVKVRIIILTFLFVIELAIVRLTPTRIPFILFSGVIAAWFVASFLYISLLPRWQDDRLHARLQVFTDLGFATVVLYVSGGIDTSFNFLYPLIVIVASILLARGWAYLTALLAFILFGAMLELSYFDVIPSFGTTRPGPRSLQAVIFINLFAYAAIAYLSGTLSAKLRQADVQLEEKSGALVNLQALHENIINSMTGGLITTDLQGRVLVLNPAGAALLEREEHEVLGRSVAQLFLDWLPSVDSDSVRAEVRSLTADGREKTFGVTAGALRVPERGLIGYLYTFNDLTDVRRLEREIRIRDRLAALGRMAEGIAHEIRQPLASIAGSVKVLSSVAALSEEQQRLVEIVDRESVRLNGIISDFLAYARDKSFRFAVLDVRAVLEDTLLLLENRAPMAARTQGDGGPALHVVRNYEAEQAWSLVDGDRIRQVFWNLGENSVRAMPEGGTLTVSLRASDDRWLISFADSGPGMSAQQVEKIFEPYQSWFEGGSGLGLAIVDQIVQAHEGRIWVRSEPGRGAEFLLELRRADPPAAQAQPAAVARGAHG